jgi:hypothetical protein
MSYETYLELIPVEGKMGDLIRSFDWSQTKLGPITTWPQSLLNSINLILASRFPMIIYWGPELNMITHFEILNANGFLL